MINTLWEKRQGIIAIPKETKLNHLRAGLEEAVREEKKVCTELLKASGAEKEALKHL